MRAYLPISHDELVAFLNSGSKTLDSILAPTPFYVGENEDLDEEEIDHISNNLFKRKYHICTISFLNLNIIFC